MIIINADDWGRSQAETDAALSCCKAGRVTSVSAMVFMEDSGRAADLAKEAGIDVGLHLNLTQPFSGQVPSQLVRETHARIARFLTVHKYAFLMYNPALRGAFRCVYEAQLDEFIRLYGRPPSHIDGHHHQHLCTNMLLDGVIAEGEKVRRSFHFWPGEKGQINRAYRHLVDRALARRYRVTDFFFALTHCLQNDRMARVTALPDTASIEIMTHPANPVEQAYLMSDGYVASLGGLKKGTYAML